MICSVYKLSEVNKIDGFVEYFTALAMVGISLYIYDMFL
jgi:hypothetical protein